MISPVPGSWRPGLSASWGKLPEQPWATAVDLGWPAIALPESLGGLGLGFVELGLVVEEHGRALAPGPFLSTVTQFAPLVREAGDPAQGERFLGPLAAGSLTGALAVASETSSGLAPDASLGARRDGEDWILDGERHYVLGGQDADEIAVAAVVEAGDGLGLFVVAREDAGVSATPSLDASRPLARIRLDGVRLGPDRVLGAPGACRPAFERAVEQALIALALETVGSCDALLELTLEYAKQREQFGQPIGSFQAVQHKFADMFMALERARAVAYFALMTQDEDDPRRALAASMAKAAAGECQQRVCKEAIQIHGGIGFTWEADVHLYVKRAKTSGTLLGGAAVHRARIADRLEL